MSFESDIEKCFGNENIAKFTVIRFLLKSLYTSYGALYNLRTGIQEYKNDIERLKKNFAPSSSAEEIITDMKNNMGKLIPNLSGLLEYDVNGNLINTDNFIGQMICILSEKKILQTDMIFGALGVSSLEELLQLTSLRESFLGLFAWDVMGGVLDNLLQRYGSVVEVLFGSNLAMIYRITDGLGIEGHLSAILNITQAMRDNFAGYINEGDLNQFTEKMPTLMNGTGLDLNALMDVDSFVGGASLIDSFKSGFPSTLIGADGFLSGGLGGLIDGGVLDMESFMGDIPGLDKVMDSFNVVNSVLGGSMNQLLGAVPGIDGMMCGAGMCGGVNMGPFNMISGAQGISSGLGTSLGGTLGGGNFGKMMNNVSGNGNLGGMLNTFTGSM